MICVNEQVFRPSVLFSWRVASFDFYFWQDLGHIHRVDKHVLWGRSYLISEGYSTEVEIITQAEAWLLLGRAAHTTLPIP